MRTIRVIRTIVIAVVVVGLLAACAAAGRDGRRDGPEWAHCMAEGHNSDYCDSISP